MLRPVKTVHCDNTEWWQDATTTLFSENGARCSITEYEAQIPSHSADRRKWRTVKGRIIIFSPEKGARHLVQGLSGSFRAPDQPFEILASLGCVRL